MPSKPMRSGPRTAWACWVLAFALGMVLPGVIAAETPAAGSLRFGMNLAGFMDHGAEFASLDLMKSTRGWYAHNDKWYENKQNKWDSGLVGRFHFDADGWPIDDIPRQVPGAEAPQILSTLWANAKALGTESLQVSWSGDGEVSMEGGQTLSSGPGKLVFKLDPKADTIKLNINRSSAKKPVRDIRVVPLKYADSKGLWNPEWLDKLKPFHTLRFMDWGRTNGSPLIYWPYRSRMEEYRWTSDRGAPYEAMIALVNELEADIWVCVPHQADADYVKNMAQLFRRELKPGLKLYVEYSNETWNWSFQQATWLKEQANRLVSWPENMAPSVQRALDIWTREWQGRDGLVRVVGVQTSWFDVARRMVGALRPGSFDAIAATCYLGYSKQSYEALAKLGAKASAADALRLVRADMETQAFPWVAAIDKLASELKVGLVFYEGGQHMTPEPFGTDQAYNPALEAAQRGEGIYQLYRDWFAKLRTLDHAKAPGGLLALHFNLASPVSGKYGSWGALESVQVKPPYRESAPKYQALLDE